MGETIVTGTLNPDVKKIITNFCVDRGDDIPDNDSDAFDVIRWTAKEVQRTREGRHRWYDDYEVIVDLGGKFLRYYDYEMNGEDATPEDCGLNYDLSHICEMKRVEKTVVAYERA